jgi:YD repeat-containing protein
MGRWLGAWTLGVCLALVGCGSSTPSPSAEAPTGGERTVPAPDGDAGTPPSAPDASTTPDGGTLSPLEAEPSLPPRACIPWTYTTPPVRATACEVSSEFADGTTQFARYDADSRLLELRTSTAAGALASVETHTWQNGLELLRRVDYPDGRFEQTEWTYDAQRRLVRRVMTGWNWYGTNSVDLTYDAQGRIAHVVGHYNTQVITSDYTYDAAGRLVSIASADTCGREETRCASLSYWPNGKLKRHAWTVFRFDNYVDEYDESGRLIHSTVEMNNSGGQSTRTYDAAGRLTRLRESSFTFTSGRDALTTTVYDPAGQRERFAEDVSHRDSCNSGVCGPDSFTHQRRTRRTTFICNTSIIGLDEWDSNEDGAVDAQRTHERDATGRLVHEEYSGTPGLDEGPVRRDFRYDCP